MAHIHCLPSELADQIAAGEVVERPASVVKELVENAIDAGAGRIAVHIELGGKRQVRVEDDGEGMGPEDARLALERHATSKIYRADDLASIQTLGFRGEALPSIASVSHFVLRTRARGTAEGTEIRVNGGTVGSTMTAAATEGTVVEVNDIFYNLPARRKFLKSDGAEAAQISRLVAQLALAYHEVGFTLTSGNRTALQYPPVASARDRLYQLYGERNGLVEVYKQAAGIVLTGFIAALAEPGPRRGPQHVFINRRIVKDRTIAHAISTAYSVASFKERSPEVHLFLQVPPEAVDVNVHPTKAEVRFREQSLVHEVVRRGLLDALGQEAVPELRLSSEHTVQNARTPSIPGVLTGGAFPSRWTALGAAEAALSPQQGTVAGSDSPALSGVEEFDGCGLPPMIPLGQFRDTFIVAIDDAGIAIIDQHVAHERVLYERILKRLSAGRLDSQRLLVPLVFDLPPADYHALIARVTELDRLGFEIDAFGDATIKVSAAPALLDIDDSAAALKALASDLEGLDSGGDVQQALQRLAATTACHAAVKANYPLTYEKMVHLLEELRATAYSTICPHGRPVMLRLTRREIEKNFERI